VIAVTFFESQMETTQLEEQLAETKKALAKAREKNKELKKKISQTPSSGTRASESLNFNAQAFEEWRRDNAWRGRDFPGQW
jgi:chromosome segregation ATPase